ncbi:hypothetical protein FACS189440_14930 [Bacteroidia bacterium]|nr:hypothetical protein FACS189440_14930 [Bacteroidia bacterium]
MKRYFAIIMLIGVVTLAQGQSVPFLNFFSDARTAAMGNAGFAVASPFAVNRNMAAILLNDAYSTEIGASYLSWQPQVTNSTLINAAGYTQYGNAGFAAGIRYNTLDAIETTDEQGNVIGSFSPSEYAMEVGFGYRINPAIALGASLRYISSDLGGEKKASAIAADISALYNSKNLSAGVGFSNVGSKIDYGNSEYALPARIQSGIACRLLDKEEHSVLGVVDAAYQLSSENKGLLGGIGAEYTYKNLASLRTGYHFEDESVGASYATVGCGVHLSGFSVNFAYILASNNNPMNQSMIISLQWGK